MRDLPKARTLTASIGLDWDMRGLTVAIGEGFSGTIAKERRPLTIRDAATDPLVTNERFRAKGVKALYGVPLFRKQRI